MIKPLISIIIPSYNVENYIAKGIESCLNQTYQNIEVIIVDDGSCDNTVSVIEKYNDERIKLIKKDNSGVSATRNIGIKNSNGDYCVFLDSDDWLELNAIEKLVEHIDETKLAACGYKRVDKEKNINVKNFNPTILKSDEVLETIGTYKYHMESSCCKLFDLNVIKDNNIYFNETITNIEDGLFVFEYLHYVKKVEYINDELWIINKREGSVTSSAFNEKRLTALMSIHIMIQEYNNTKKIESGLLLYLAKTLRYLIVSMYFSNYENKYKSQIKHCKKELMETIQNSNTKKGSFYDSCSFAFFAYFPYTFLNFFMKIFKKLTGRI